jgi:DNA-binding HxlR family transcriptional regulator
VFLGRLEPAAIARPDSPGNRTGTTPRETAAHGAPDETQPTELAYDVFSHTCPSCPALEHVTGRWGILALSALGTGPLRFNALRRQVNGISQKMLAQALQSLERDGFVHREVQSPFPPRVEYSLTPLGRQTATKRLDLIEHLESQMPAVLTAQLNYDRGKGAQS